MREWGRSEFLEIGLTLKLRITGNPRCSEDMISTTAPGNYIVVRGLWHIRIMDFCIKL